MSVDVPDTGAIPTPDQAQGLRERGIDPANPSAIQTDSIQAGLGETDDDTPDPDAPDYTTALAEGGGRHTNAPARPAGSGSPLTRVVGHQS